MFGPFIGPTQDEPGHPQPGKVTHEVVTPYGPPCFSNFKDRFSRTTKSAKSELFLVEFMALTWTHTLGRGMYAKTPWSHIYNFMYPTDMKTIL